MIVLLYSFVVFLFFFSSRRRHTRCSRDWSSDVCSSDLHDVVEFAVAAVAMSERDRAVILEMGGLEALSQLDAVRVFEKKLGKKFTLDFVPVEALEGQYCSSDPLQKTFGALMLGYAKGDVIGRSEEH